VWIFVESFKHVETCSIHILPLSNWFLQYLWDTAWKWSYSKNISNSHLRLCNPRFSIRNLWTTKRNHMPVFPFRNLGSALLCPVLSTCHKVLIFLFFQTLFTQEQRLFPILDILKESYIQLSVNNLGYIRMGRGSKALRSSAPRCMIKSSRSLKKIGIEPHYVGWT